MIRKIRLNKRQRKLRLCLLRAASKYLAYRRPPASPAPFAVYIYLIPNHNTTVSAHQQLHAEVESLREKVRSGERRVQDCARRLTEADAALKGPLAAAKRLLEAGRKAEAGEGECPPESRSRKLDKSIKRDPSSVGSKVAEDWMYLKEYVLS